MTPQQTIRKIIDAHTSGNEGDAIDVLEGYVKEKSIGFAEHLYIQKVKVKKTILKRGDCGCWQIWVNDEATGGIVAKYKTSDQLYELYSQTIKP